MAAGKVDERAVYLCTGNPLPEDLQTIANWLFNEDFATCFESGPLASVLHSQIHQLHTPGV